jgi:hypothetical protein
MLGLLIEMLGIFALVFRTGTDEGGVPVPGSFSRLQVWIVIGSGFAIWLLGSILTYWPRSARKARSSTSLDLDDLKL